MPPDPRQAHQGEEDNKAPSDDPVRCTPVPDCNEQTEQESRSDKHCVTKHSFPPNRTDEGSIDLLDRKGTAASLFVTL
jgi:hypothetical protein